MVTRFVIADDLSGAADAGVRFGGRGPVSVGFAPGSPWAEDAGAAGLQVWDTETRGALPAAAARAVEAACAALVALAGPRPAVFKKVDSTLRGPVGAELEAARAGLGRQRVLLAPALPEQGRTVVGGVLHVDGVAGARAGAGLGPGVVEVGLAEVRSGADFLAGAGARLIVVDAAGERDLDLVARTLAGHPEVLAAGSAGLAGALARLAPDRGLARPVPRSPWVVVTVGSTHPRAVEQLRLLRAAGPAGVVIVDEPAGRAPSPEARLADLGRRTAATLAGLPASSAVVASGGATALAVCRALGAVGLRPMGEVLPGLPWSHIGGGERVLVTKAGGFGAPEALLDAVRRLTAPAGLLALG